MNTRRNATLVGIALLLSLGAGAPASGSWPGDNGRIVSVEPRYDWENCPQEEGGHCDAPPPLGEMIVIRNRDGSDKTDLVKGFDPTWDAEGRKIAYVTSGYRIKKINADGTHMRLLTAPYAEPGEEEMIDARPAWSPTGNRIAFQRTWEGTRRKIMILEIDDTLEPVELTSGMLPEWSARGRIAYLHRVNGVRKIHTIRPDGEEHAIVPHTRGATDFAWSPDGMKLAFVTPGDDQGECMHVVRIDGSHKRTLACRFRGADGGNVAGLTWAPNGDGLLVGVQNFYSEPVYSEGRLVRVLLDGTKRQLGAMGYMPDWQPR